MKANVKDIFKKCVGILLVIAILCGLGTFAGMPVVYAISGESYESGEINKSGEISKSGESGVSVNNGNFDNFGIFGKRISFPSELIDANIGGAVNIVGLANIGRTSYIGGEANISGGTYSAAVAANVAPLSAGPQKSTLTIRARTGGAIAFGTSGQYETGQVINIAATPNDGYVFDGWTSTGGAFGDAAKAVTTFTMPAYAVTVTANFALKPPALYSVTYSLNGGSGTAPVEADKTVGAAIAIAANTGLVAPAGKRFKEWNTKNDGSGVGYAPGTTIAMPGANLTIYAIWENMPARYTVTINGSYAWATGAGNHAAGDTVYIYAGTRSGYIFDGWTTTSSGVKFANANDAETTFIMPGNNVSVTAGWRSASVATPTPKPYASPTPKPPASSSPKPPASSNRQSSSQAAGDASPAPRMETAPGSTPSPSWVNPYIDVLDTDWFYDAVRFVSENGLMQGIGGGIFSPDVTLTRAMLVTVLWRLEGAPAASSMYAGFTDVEQGSWYEDAVGWAAYYKIVVGYLDGSFQPETPVTREEAVVILFRYAASKSLDVGASTDLSRYTDINEISAWAMDAMRWAIASGIVQGRTETTAAPQGTCTRAEIATIFKRYINGY